MRKAATVGLATLVLGLCGTGQAASRRHTPADARLALGARLHGKLLSYHWIGCFDTPYRDGHRRVFRCKVNFGEPHIVGYCLVFRGEQALTNIELPSLRCRRERNRG